MAGLLAVSMGFKEIIEPGRAGRLIQDYNLAMIQRPKTHYAKSGDVNIAYQISGQGPLDLVIVPGWISHLDMDWEDPTYPRYIKRLTQFCRVIRFDKRGTGLSDPDVGDFTLDDRMDDLRAVMDAAGSEQAAIMGASEGGILTLLYAASHPERVRAVILAGAYPRGSAAPDYPQGAEMASSFDWIEQHVRESWGDGSTLDRLWPAMKDIPEFRDYVGRYERASQSPKSGLVHLGWARDVDVRPAARALSVPCLVLHRTGDLLCPISGGRWFAENIPGAQFVEQPGNEHLIELGDSSVFLDALEKFLTGNQSATVEVDRVLATVLFTDIVDSTNKLAKLGDRRWREILEQHYALLRDQIARYRGREIDTTGDGMLATFDGPARAIRCGMAMRDAVRRLGIEIRVGVHTGECEVRGEKIAGIAVHTGARIMAEAGASEVLVSSMVKDLVAGAGIDFTDRGQYSLKGIPGQWQLFSVQ